MHILQCKAAGIPIISMSKPFRKNQTDPKPHDFDSPGRHEYRKIALYSLLCHKSPKHHFQDYGFFNPSQQDGSDFLPNAPKTVKSDGFICD